MMDRRIQNAAPISVLILSPGFPSGHTCRTACLVALTISKQWRPEMDQPFSMLPNGIIKTHLSETGIQVCTLATGEICITTHESSTDKSKENKIIIKLTHNQFK